MCLLVCLSNVELWFENFLSVSSPMLLFSSPSHHFVSCDHSEKEEQKDLLLDLRVDVIIGERTGQTHSYIDAHTYTH